MITDPKFKEGCYFFYKNTKSEWLIGKVLDIYTGNGVLTNWHPITISFKTIFTSCIDYDCTDNTFEVGSRIYRSSLIVLNLEDVIE